MTRERFDELMAGFPRCAQRGKAHRGGKSKRAIPDRALAEELARTATVIQGRHVRAYRCPLPAPSIGGHWHLTTQKVS